MRIRSRGVKLLSQLTIDANKSMNSKSLTSLNTVSAGYFVASDYIYSSNTDNAFVTFMTRQNGIGLSEVARLSGAAVPTFDLLVGRLTGNLNANSKAILNRRFDVGDILIGSSDAGANTVSVPMVLLKTLTLSGPADLRIKFLLQTNSEGNPVYAQIRKNGVAIGTLRTSTALAGVTFSEDIIGWNATNTIELWASASAGLTATVSAFRAYVGHGLPTAV